MHVPPPAPPSVGRSEEEEEEEDSVSPPSLPDGRRSPPPPPPRRFPRVYQVWKGSNVFVLQGRLVFGPDVRSLFFTLVLIIVPVAAFCIFVARKLMDDFSHHTGISIMAVVIVFTIYDLTLLLVTSGRDPGIIPRNRHPPEMDVYHGATEGQTPQLRLPRMKDVVVNGMTVKVKYCDTCMLYRPPRCSHCSICNNCVEHFDHHCPWVGQCIGLRNYRFFFMFVFSTTLLCIYVFAFCWVYVKQIMDSEEITIWRALIKTPASIILIIYTFICVWFVGGLSVFHLYLISTNQTTYENFRYRYDGRPNPYNIGIIRNFKEKFFSSIPPSKNNFRAVIPEEPSLPARNINVGFISPNIGRAMGDLELGRKATWSEAANGVDLGELESGAINERVDNKDDIIGYLSPNYSPDRSSEIIEERVGMHSRRSSWNSKTENMETALDVVAPEVQIGESKERNHSDKAANL